MKTLVESPYKQNIWLTQWVSDIILLFYARNTFILRLVINGSHGPRLIYK